MKKSFTVALPAVLFALTATTSFGQETSAERMEARIMMLEEQLFNLKNDTNFKNGTLTVNPNESSVLADFEMRLQQIEGESQKVYGAMEELGHSVEQFAKKMDLISKDYDLRLQDLEKSSANTAELLKELDKKIKSASMASAIQAEEQAKKAEAKKEALKKDVKKSEKSEKKSDSKVAGDMSAEDLYTKAYNLLVATSYDEAESLMKEFIDRHDSHKLADNAYYWLGEIYLVKEQPEKAVVSFSTGLSKFPEGAKAPSNLLKMGTAFKRMGKVDYAKSSWKKLIHDFKESSEAGKAAKELAELES